MRHHASGCMVESSGYHIITVAMNLEQHFQQGFLGEQGSPGLDHSGHDRVGEPCRLPWAYHLEGHCLQPAVDY